MLWLWLRFQKQWQCEVLLALVWYAMKTMLLKVVFNADNCDQGHNQLFISGRANLKKWSRRWSPIFFTGFTYSRTAACCEYLTSVAVTLARPLNVSKVGQSKKGKTKEAIRISDFHAHGSMSNLWPIRLARS